MKSMKDYRIAINTKNIKKIPRRDIVWVALFWVLAIISLVEICLPVYCVLDDAQEYDIHIDDVYVRYGRRSSKQLVIVSDDRKYCLWYPPGEYREYADRLRDDLLTGEVQNVTVKAAEDSSLYGRISGNKLAVELKSDSAVYYDLDTAMQYLRHSRVTAWAGFIVFSVASAAVTAFGMISYKVICFEKKAGGKK